MKSFINLKKSVLTLFILLFAHQVVYLQPLTRSYIENNIVGFWKKKGDGNPSGFTKEKNHCVLAFNTDSTVSYYVNNKKASWGTYSVDSNQLWQLVTTMRKNIQLYPNPYDVIKLGGYIMKLDKKQFVFGYSAVDATDEVYERMSQKEIEDFFDKTLLEKAFTRKSDKRMMAYFQRWQDMEPSIEAEYPQRFLNRYQTEAYQFFSDFHTNRLRGVKGKRFAIVDTRLKCVSSTDFDYPTQAELDSFVDVRVGKKNYRAIINNDRIYNAMVSDNFLGAYFEAIIVKRRLPIDNHALTSFMPYFDSTDEVTFLPLRPHRKSIMDKLIRQNETKRYENWYFIKRFTCFSGGVQYDYTDTPRITSLLFNRMGNLAIVDFDYPYSYVTGLYQKLNGKWISKAKLFHMTQ